MSTSSREGEDNEGNEDTVIDNATVDFTDVAPDIEVTKTANLTAVPKPAAMYLHLRCQEHLQRRSGDHPSP